MKPWPHKWFGFWQEQGPKYGRCPSVFEFVDPKSTVSAEVIAYLTSATLIGATSRFALPCVICGDRTGALCFRTDGEWYWLDDLAHYAINHHIRMPDEFIAAMQKHGFVPPQIPNDELPNVVARLDKPLPSDIRSR